MRARTSGVTAADVDRALTEDRSLVVTWLNRGTLHLVRSEDYPIIQAVTTPPLRTSSERRLAQEGVPPRDVERGIEAIERSLADEGPLTSDALRERIAAAGVRAEGQALYHLLFQASLRGLIVRGPMAGKKQAYVLVRDWLPDAKPVDRDAALGEFARRYLVGHGPGHRPRPRALGRHPAARRARRPRRGGSSRRSREEAPSSRLRGSSAASSRACSAGRRARTSWASSRPTSSRWAGCSTRSPWWAGGRWRGGSCATAASSSSPFRRISKADRAALERDAEDVRRFLG